jgi:hypothetical protein
VYGSRPVTIRRPAGAGSERPGSAAPFSVLTTPSSASLIDR